ncbi:helix-turn-helix DNA binding domain protein [Microbacterium phage Teamocil]|uniref:Helix-turn-helix DNA binding domain protein n=1 Tax=Microbacterium phage Teamocil TaxID=2656554 RepID=A0A649VYN1_9CAUD|nr:helix-turn-helix DNA binding domain protein [Microbacterium phage Teamocil]QGJ88922.1 helix-turn-helix DNA binding domain protein [Microbacterium phage Gina]QGJ97019.1 helix-turn-helix DNA binding domain protein [Microbacterium phage Teamocil]
MSGSNGLHPVVNLNERQKCPAHPSKRKYTDGAEAGRAAQKSSKDSGLDIVAYMCEACGHYHLTKSTGGDSVTLPDGKFTVGEFRALSPNHPVFSGNPAEEPPIVPGDHETRVKFARRFLEQNPEPTSEELCMALGGCTKDMLRKVMRDLGYRNTRGRFARWVKDDRPQPDETPLDPADAFDAPDVSRETSSDERTPLDLSYDNDAPESPTVWHGGRDVPWREARLIENAERLRHIPLGDLIDTYAAAGLRLVLSLEERDA